MKILDLVVTQHWYNEIVSGSKNKEYRDYKAYYASRLCAGKKESTRNFKKYDAVRFRAGYAKNAPRAIFVHIDTCIGIGERALGASGIPQYIIYLGNMIEL